MPLAMTPPALEIATDHRRQVGPGKGREIELVGRRVDVPVRRHGLSSADAIGSGSPASIGGGSDGPRPARRLVEWPDSPEHSERPVIDFTLTDENRLVQQSARAF